MSSAAPTPQRSPEKDPRSARQLHQLNGINPPAVEAASLALADPDPEILADSSRVEKLLAQLEAHSMALVPYGRFTAQEPPQRSNVVLAAGLVLLWLTSLIGILAFVKYSNHPLLTADRAAAATPLMIPSAADPQDQRIANSVDHLTKALASSSERMTEIEAAVERSSRDMQRMAARTAGPKLRPAENKPFEVETSTPAESQATVILAAATPPAAIPAAAIPAAAATKDWHRVLDIKPTDTAVAHHAADGSVDYWLVPRNGDKSPTAKVLPVATTLEGVVVHSLDDGKDYTLTPSGDWRNGALPAEKQ